MSRDGSIFSPMRRFLHLLLLAMSLVPALLGAQRPRPVRVRPLAVAAVPPMRMPVELTRGQRVIAGVLVGGAVGAAAGALIGVATCDQCDHAGPVITTTAIGAGAGVVVGIIWAGAGMSNRLRSVVGFLRLVGPARERRAADEPGTPAAVGLP